MKYTFVLKTGLRLRLGGQRRERMRQAFQECFDCFALRSTAVLSCRKLWTSCDTVVL